MMSEQWPIIPLRDLCEDFKKDIVDGPFGSNLKREHYTDLGITVLKIQNIKPFKIKLHKIDYVSEDKAEELKRHSFVKGDIIMTKLGKPLGVSAIVEELEEGIIVADLVRIRAQKINTKFLCYQLNSPKIKTHINSLQKGTTRPRVRITIVRDIPIVVPPPEEQQRIVRVLDEAFEKISETVMQTKNSLLQNNELYGQILNQMLENSNGEWVEKNLDGICTVKRGSSPRPIKNYITEDPKGVNWIKIGDTKGVDKYITKTRQKITKEGAERSRQVNKGDLLLSNSMSYGKPFIMGISGYIHDGWFVLHTNREVDSEFLFYALSSKLVQNQFSNLAAGSVVKNISGDLVKKAVIPIPSLSEQKQFVEDIKNLYPPIKSLTSVFNAKLGSLDELKLSILQEAFNGNLTKEITA
jgi:type I restriction enzyme, S subunit